MPIDPYIASGIKLPQFNLPDYGADMAQMAQVQTARNQNALAQYQLGAAQRAEEESLGIKNYLAENAGKSPAELQSGLFRFGAAGLAMAKALSEQQTAELTRNKTKQDIYKAKRDFADQSFRNISLNPSDENIKAWAQDAVIQDFMTKEEADAKANSLIAMTVPERQAYMASQGAQSKELIALFESKPIKQSDGQQEWLIESNKRLPNFGQPITSKVQMQVTPGQQLTAAVTREGQAITQEGQQLSAAVAREGQASVAETAAARLAADVKNWERMDLLARDQLAAQIENWNNLDARAKATLQESVRSTNLQDARARAALSETIRNNNLQDARSRASLAEPKYNAERGGFVYPPTKENPEGKFVALTGGDGKPLTEAQGNSTAYGMRMTQANQIIQQLANEGTERSAIGAGGPYGIGGVVNALPSVLGGANAKQQQFQQAKINFITAVLRKESGAAIGQDEFNTEDKKYFPQVGDTDAVKAQKAQARQTAIEAMKIQAGPGAKEIEKFGAGSKTSGAATGSDPLGLRK